MFFYGFFQSWARGNTAAITWSCFQNTKLLVTAILLSSLYLLHLNTEKFNIFEFFLVPEALLCCRVVVVAKLNNFRLPCSDFSNSAAGPGLQEGTAQTPFSCTVTHTCGTKLMYSASFIGILCTPTQGMATILAVL